MTLSAMTAERQIFNPSVLIERGADRVQVARSAYARSKRAELFCPHCYERNGNLINVNFRNTQAKRVHFYHPTEEGHECSNYAPESEKHFYAKAAIQAELEYRKFGDVIAEAVLKKDNSFKWRRPDITVTFPNGVIEGHEIQISPITTDEMEERTRILKEIGVHRIHWYLYGKNYNRSLRQHCHYSNIPAYRLWFKDGDVGVPEWKLDQFAPIQSDRRQSQNSVDNCRAKPKAKKQEQSDKSGMRSYTRPNLPPIVVDNEGIEPLARWFLSVDRSVFPDLPFQLDYIQKVVSPVFYDVIERECQAVIDYAEKRREKPHPRHASGALLRDLRKLQAIAGTTV